LSARGNVSLWVVVQPLGLKDARQGRRSCVCASFAALVCARVLTALRTSASTFSTAQDGGITPSSIGKATTLADGHFLHHDREGALQAEGILLRLRAPRAEVARVTRLVRHHMFTYTRDWTDSAVRRFVRRVGTDLLQDLFALRAADDVASGVEEPPSGWRELRERVAATAGDPLEARQLAVDGDDLVGALGIDPGPMIGRLLDGLLEAVLEDPSLNTREDLLELARAMASG